MRHLLFILAATALAGCASQIPQPVLTHTAEPVCRDGGPAARLQRGMSPQDVTAQIGEPMRKEPFRYGDLPAETWYYSDASLNDYVELTNGKLASWRFQRCGVLGE